MSKPLILITNDDGYNAKGLMSLVNASLTWLTPRCPKAYNHGLSIVV